MHRGGLTGTMDFQIVPRILILQDYFFLWPLVSSLWSILHAVLKKPNIRQNIHQDLLPHFGHINVMVG